MDGGGGVQETQDQIQEQKNNTKLWNYYQESYKPFIDKHIKQTVTNTSTPAQARNVAGQVNAEVMKGAITRQSNPVAVTKQMDNVGEAATEAQANAQGKLRQRQLGSLQNIVDIGRGQQTTAQQTQEQIAGQSVQSAIRDKEADLQTEAAYENAAGSIAGATVAGVNRYMSRPATTGSFGVLQSDMNAAPADSYGVMQSDENLPAFNTRPWFSAAR